jgi:hypothetical protein
MSFSCSGDLLAQTRQLGALRRGQRPVVTGCRSLDASLVGDSCYGAAAQASTPSTQSKPRR